MIVRYFPAKPNIAIFLSASQYRSTNPKRRRKMLSEAMVSMIEKMNAKVASNTENMVEIEFSNSALDSDVIDIDDAILKHYELCKTDVSREVDNHNGKLYVIFYLKSQVPISTQHPEVLSEGYD
jgi:hypothetical protein